MLAQLAARLRARGTGGEGGGGEGEEGVWGPVMVDDNCSVSLRHVGMVGREEY